MFGKDTSVHDKCVRKTGLVIFHAKISFKMEELGHHLITVSDSPSAHFCCACNSISHPHPPRQAASNTAKGTEGGGNNLPPALPAAL